VSHQKLNELNRALHKRLDMRSDVFLTQTVLVSADGEEGGTFCLRLAAGGVSTEWSHVEAAWKIVQEEGAAVLAA
jgi:hypothetical protein